MQITFTGTTGALQVVYDNLTGSGMINMKSDVEKDSNTIQLCCNDEEYAFLKKHAKTLDLPLGDYVKVVAIMNAVCFENDLDIGWGREQPYKDPEYIRYLTEFELQHPGSTPDEIYEFFVREKHTKTE